MSLISLRQLLDHAAENNYGVPAFNVNNLEAIRAIMEGAKELNSPVILQASGAARKYAGPIFVKKLVEAAMVEFSEIPTVLHQDHGGSPKDCKNCIELGFTSVMMDGSLLDDQKTPSDFEYNVRVTKETTDMAHALGVSVEGEIGCLGSLETGTGEKEDGVGAEGKLDHDQLPKILALAPLHLRQACVPAGVSYHVCAACSPQRLGCGRQPMFGGAAGFLQPESGFEMHASTLQQWLGPMCSK